MITKNTAHGDTLMVYKKGTTKKETLNNVKRRVIDNKQQLVVGSTGSGKSVFANSIAYEFYKHGYTVLYVTEKPGNSFDNAFCIFPVDQRYQENLLRLQKQEPLPIEYIENLAKFYHPFSFEIPKGRKELPMNYFTFALKDISEGGFAALLAGDKDNTAVRTCVRTVRDLDDEANLYEFMSEVSKRADDDEDIEIDMDNFGLDTKVDTRKDVLQKIVDGFKPFRKHNMVRPKNDPLNIDFVEVLNDQKSMHFLSTAHVKSRRVKYFTYLEVNQQVKKALESGRVKHPVLLVYEEIKVLLPKDAKVSYQSQLAEQFRELLATIRTKGKGVATLATTQSMNTTNKEYIDALTADSIFLGKLSQPDIGALKRTNPAFQRIDQGELLDSLDTGQFIWLSDVLRGNIRKLLAFVPPFKIAEEGDDFMKMYKHYYNHKLVNNTKFMNEQKKMFDNLEKDAKKRLKEAIKRKKELEKQKELNKEAKELEKQAAKDRAKEQKQKEKDAQTVQKLKVSGDLLADKKILQIENLPIKAMYSREEVGKIGYILMKKYEGMTWTGIGKLLGVGRASVRNNAKRYAQVVDDKHF